VQADTRFLNYKAMLRALLCAFAGALVPFFDAAYPQTATFPMSYSGRLTLPSGEPLSGPVDIDLRFWSAESGGTELGAPFQYQAVQLNQGLFQLRLPFTSIHADEILGDLSEPVFVEVTARGVTYPRQELRFVPLALRVPVDSKTLKFGANGRLSVVIPPRTDSDSYLGFSSDGTFTWERRSASSIMNQPVSPRAPRSGEVLTYDGSQWVPQSTMQTGTISLSPNGVTAGTYPRATVAVDATGRVVSAESGTPIDLQAEVTGTLSVSHGGTGLTTLTENYLVAGNGTNPIQLLAPGTAGNVLISTGNSWESSVFPWATPGTIGSTAPNTGAFTSIMSNAQAGYEAKPFGVTAGNTGEVRFDELAANGTNYVGFKAPDAIAANKVWVLPTADGTAGQVLKTDGSGNLGWVSAAGGSVTSVGITAPAAGITVTGGPITSAGSMTLALSNDLAAVEGLATTGGVERTGADTWATYALTAAGKALIADVDATAQRSTLGLGALATAGAVSGGSGGTITDGTITNDDIATAAAIVDTKLATISTAGKVSGSAITSGTIAGSTAINSTGALASSAQGAFEAKPFGTAAGNTSEVRFDELAANGTNYVGFKAPDILGANRIWTLPATDGTAGQVLKTDGAGALSWVSAATGSVTNVTGTAPISVATGTSTPVISMSQANTTTSGFLSNTDWNTFNSKQAAGNYVTLLYGDVTSTGFASGSVSTTLASVAIAGTSTKVTYDVKGRVTSGTSLSASDIPTLTSNQITTSLGYTPINRAGDSMSGALNHGAFDINNTGNIQMAASKTLALSTNTSDPAGLVAADKGKTWFNATTNQIKYWDGSAAVALGVSGSGLSSLNGQTGNTQTFAAPGNSGTAPAWSSTANAHTLNIPMASAASVTAGLLSNTDYNAFSNKVTNVAQGTGIAVATASGTATVSLGTIGTAGNYTKVTTDAYGRVTAGTSLTPADLPAHSASLITSGTLSVANGGTGATALTLNNVILGNGTNPVQVVAPGTSGNVLTSNGTTWQSTAMPATTWATPGTIGSTTPNTGAFTSITSNAQAGYEAKPFGVTAGNTGEVRFDELAANGTNYVGFKAPDALAANKVWVLPTADGTAGQVLKTDGAGNLGWVSAAGGSVTSVGITAPAAGITVTGGPITSSGSMTLALSNDLAAVEALATTGGVERTAADTWTTYTLTAAGKALLDDADATAQRTTLGLGALATATAVSGGSGGTITDGTVVNADISMTAAIATSKLSGPVTAITGNGLGTLATASAVSGGSGGTITDGTITNDDIAAAAAIADTKLATISTAGKVSGTAITSGNITTSGAIASSAQGAFEAKPFGAASGNTSEVRFDELAANGTNYVGFKAPDLLGANRIWTLPATDGTAGQVLKTDGAGNLGWVAAAGGSVTNVTGTAPISVATGTSTPVISMSQANTTTSGFLSNTDWNTFNAKQTAGNYVTLLYGDVTSTGFASGSVTTTLASVALAGTATKITYDVKGRVLSGTNLTPADLPAHSASLITSGTLRVANGGTGATSLAANNVILGNGTNPVQVVAPGTSGNVLTSNGTTWQSTALPATTWATPGTIGSTTPNTGAFTSITSNAQAGYEAKPFGAAAGNTGEVRFDELAANGTNYVGFKAPDALAANKVWVLPTADGTAGQVLKTDGSGNLGWVSAAGGSVTSVGITAPAAGITVTGGPITSAGSMTLALSNDLGAVEGLTTTGGVERTAADTWTTYTLTAAGKALLDDADATAQRATLGLAALATATAVSGGSGGTILDGTITDSDIAAAAGISDAKLGVITTAGKVSGSAITSGTISGTTSFATSGNVTTTGRIGIGSANPAGPLDVSGAFIAQTGSITIRSEDSAAEGGQLVLAPGGARTVTWTMDNFDNRLRFFSDATEDVTILANGNVGIGLVAPSQKLAVAGTIETTGGIKFADGTTQTTAASANQWTTSGSDVYRASGNVGVGVSAPGATLEVNGTIKSSGEQIGTMGSGYGQSRFVNGNYGIINRNDGSNYYILITASGDPYGIWNGLRPFTLNLASGDLTMNGVIARASGSVDYTGAQIASGVGTIRDAGGGWVRTYGETGWYSQTYGGGWYMYDTSWIRAYGGKNIHTSGAIQGDSVVQSGYLYSWGNGKFDGAVGIGMDPSVKLDVNGTINAGTGGSRGAVLHQPCTTRTAAHPNVATCAGNEQVTGGSCRCGNSLHLTSGSYPSGNGWACNRYCTAGGWDWSQAATAYAICCVVQ